MGKDILVALFRKDMDKFFNTNPFKPLFYKGFQEAGVP